MTSTAFYNDPISVTASTDSSGHVTPRSLVWQDREYILTAVGRQWADEEGRHVLVEAAGGNRFEIQLSRKDLVWRLKRAWPGELAA